MSVKIKVSYTDDGELAGVIRLLSPILRNVRVQPQKGRFKRAYIELNHERTTSESVRKC
ncbi:MAG TPA: hypothetical protein H9780_04975 [Candidatus Mediterraneibacter merdavium]|nr:hypothetical protein [Candidatus Mediterraneibacter merdavium]